MKERRYKHAVSTVPISYVIKYCLNAVKSGFILRLS